MEIKADDLFDSEFDKCEITDESLKRENTKERRK